MCSHSVRFSCFMKPLEKRLYNAMSYFCQDPSLTSSGAKMAAPGRNPCHIPTTLVVQSRGTDVKKRRKNTVFPHHWLYTTYSLVRLSSDIAILPLVSQMFVQG